MKQIKEQLNLQDYLLIFYFCFYLPQQIQIYYIIPLLLADLKRQEITTGEFAIFLNLPSLTKPLLSWSGNYLTSIPKDRRHKITIFFLSWVQGVNVQYKFLAYAPTWKFRPLWPISAFKYIHSVIMEIKGCCSDCQMLTFSINTLSKLLFFDIFLGIGPA